MNKQYLKSYMNKGNKNELKTNCYRVFKTTFEKGYIISDTFSIIVLNDNYDLHIEDFDKFGLEKMLDHFNNDFTNISEYIRLYKDKDDSIDENFAINHKLFDRIQKVIKGNKAYVLENNNKDDYMRYIIKIENTKTNEYAYMLPMRKF